MGRIVGHILLLRSALGVAAVLTAFAFGLVLQYDRATLITLALLAGAAVLRVLANSYLSVLQALEHVRAVAVVKSEQALVLAIAAGSWRPVQPRRRARSGQ